MTPQPTRDRHSKKGRQSALFAVVINLLLAAVKMIAGIVGHCYALVADGIESAADVASSLIVWSGLRIASIPPDNSHPYGHGKAEPLAGLAVAIMLIVAAIGIAIQSIREIVSPHYAPASWTLAVLLGVIITKESLFRWVIKIGEDIDSTAVKSDAWHHRSDAFTSAAAFLGILIAVLGGERYKSADDWAALFAAFVIVFNGCRLMRPALAEVMDAAPHPEVEASVRQAAAKVAGVAGLEKCYVRKMGFDLYVDIHVEVDGHISVHDGHAIAHDVKNAVRRTNPLIADVLVHIEPAKPR